MFEFIEESDAWSIWELSNIEHGYVDGWGMGVSIGRKTSLVLTFVLLSTHLIIYAWQILTVFSKLPSPLFSHHFAIKLNSYICRECFDGVNLVF
jgi:hypothetical protein